MPSVRDSLSFGQYLQALRLEKKISLERISDETRIGLSMLQLIEKEDHDSLPDEVFVKGFLRSYAKAVGADGDEAVRRYESRRKVLQKLDATDLDSGTTPTRWWWKMILICGLFVTLIFLSVFGLAFMEHYLSDRSVRETENSGEMAPVGSPQTPAESTDEGVPKAPDSAKHELYVVVVEDTWIKIIIDNGSSRRYELKAGDDLKLEAKSNFNLLIGNAAGVKLTLNDKAIAVSGKSGEFVNLDLP
jgi:cytoskeletal protein RodZ